MKRRTRAPLAVRIVGRLAATAVALMVFTLVGIQFARVIEQNVALARELSSTQHDIARLEAHRTWQRRQLRRLEDPDGAIPEIHERLRLVRKNEALIFVSPAPSADPASP
ncbi:MAG: hypothetical protein KGN02_03365 [bacterium]|nr:hypothetical protein [bacterium]